LIAGHRHHQTAVHFHALVMLRMHRGKMPRHRIAAAPFGDLRDVALIEPRSRADGKADRMRHYRLKRRHDIQQSRASAFT
jgi:hypothetical protein